MHILVIICTQNLVSVLYYCCSFHCVIICILVFSRSYSVASIFSFFLSGSFDWETLRLIQSFLASQNPYLISILLFLIIVYYFVIGEQINKFMKLIGYHKF